MSNQDLLLLPLMEVPHNQRTVFYKSLYYTEILNTGAFEKNHAKLNTVFAKTAMVNLQKIVL